MPRTFVSFIPSELLQVIGVVVRILGLESQGAGFDSVENTISIRQEGHPEFKGCTVLSKVWFRKERCYIKSCECCLHAAPNKLEVLNLALILKKG